MNKSVLVVMIGLVLLLGFISEGVVSAGWDVAPTTPEIQEEAVSLAAAPVQSITLTAMRAMTPTARIYLPMIVKPAPPIYWDHFDDPQSGWYVGPALRYNKWCNWRYGCNEGWEEVTTLSYADGHYRFFVPTTWHGGDGKVDTWFVWPVETAPLPDTFYPLPQNYCVEARGLFVGDEEYSPWWAHWGVVFGAEADLSEVYSLQVNVNHDLAMLHHHNYQYPGNRQPLGGEEINVENQLVPWSGDNPWIPSHEYNKIKVVVQGSRVRAFVNDRLVNEIYLPDGLPRDRIGLIGGSWEVTPIDIRIDYFRYEPNCSEVQP